MIFVNILITGAAGFIGSSFACQWAQENPNHHIVVLDALTYAGQRSNLEALEQHPGFHFVEGNIRNTALISQLLREHRIDCIVNFAAESHVDRSIADPMVFHHTNTEGTLSLLMAVRDVWKKSTNGKRFIQVSTDEVYGSFSGQGMPFTENSPCRPGNPYSASKAAADAMVLAFHNTYGLDVVITRSSNNYGPNQYPEKLIPKTIKRILQNEPIPLYGDGLHQRDWIHVLDNARGIALAIQKGKPGAIYNLGAGEEVTNRYLVQQLCRCMNRLFSIDRNLTQRFPMATAAQRGQAEILIPYVADRPGHDLAYTMDTTLSQQVLGFQPQLALEAGLEQTVRAVLQPAARHPA